MILIAALSGALLVGGVLGIVYGLQRRPVRPARPRRVRRPATKDRLIVLAAAAVGTAATVVTGWLALLLVVPAAVWMGLRAWRARSHRRTQRLNALAEFARGVGGVLGAGRGLEQAILHAARSAPQPLTAEVGRLSARLRANWSTTKALWSFADDVDDATGDLFVATLTLAAQRRGPGVASAITGLAESIDAEVRARRAVEAEQQKARTASRIITVISAVMLIGLFVAGSYVAPYASPLGQLLLLIYMALYLLVLVWMGRISKPTPLPRFIGAGAARTAGKS